MIIPPPPAAAREAKHREKMAIKYALENSEAGREALNQRHRLLRLLREEQEASAEVGERQPEVRRGCGRVHVPMLHASMPACALLQGASRNKRGSNVICSLGAALDGTCPTPNASLPSSQSSVALRRELLNHLEREVTNAQTAEQIQRARGEVLSIRSAAEGILRAMLEEKRERRAREMAQQRG